MESSVHGRLKLITMIAAALLCVGLVSACTGPTPLYGRAVATDVAAYAFTYGRPASRSDQVIYRELRLRLRLPPNNPGAADTIGVTVSSYTYPRSLTRSKISAPTTPFEMVAVANVTVTRADGTAVFSGQRTASAAYNTVSQVLADKQAELDAAERASVAVAESVRLAILTALARS